MNETFKIKCDKLLKHIKLEMEDFNKMKDKEANWRVIELLKLYVSKEHTRHKETILVIEGLIYQAATAGVTTKDIFDSLGYLNPPVKRKD